MMNRKSNGEGYLGTVTEKHKRKKFLSEICKTCAECENKCNREQFEICDKCKDCKEECLKYCDRYYCYKRVHSQITIDGKQTTVASSKNKSEAINRKKQAEAKALIGNYVRKNEVRILDLIKKIDEEKLKIGRIKQTTQNKNKYEYKKIENDYINQIPIQKITYHHLQEFLNLHRYLSQSELDKLVQKLKAGFNRAVIEKFIAYADNPMLRIQVPVSYKDAKEVVPFDLDEEINLLKYLATTDRLIKSNKCNYDDNTIRNLIICGLFTGARIGELGSINYTKHIDLKNKNLIVSTTLTKDKNEHVILGNETKTGRYKKLRSKKDVRYIPFALFDSEILIHILQEKTKIAGENKYNKNNLLFCQKDGNVINHIGINSLFKRICREAKVKLELETGCHFHMTRHTAITRLIEIGTDPMIIAAWVGHTSTRQIEETYGHILQNFKNWQLEYPGEYYKKEDLITKEIKKLLLSI